MKGTMLYGAPDVRFEEREFPKFIEPTDAIIRISATCARNVTTLEGDDYAETKTRNERS